MLVVCLLCVVSFVVGRWWWQVAVDIVEIERARPVQYSGLPMYLLAHLCSLLRVTATAFPSAAP